MMLGVREATYRVARFARLVWQRPGGNAACSLAPAKGRRVLGRHVAERSWLMSESGPVRIRRSHGWASDAGWRVLARRFVGGRRGALGVVLGLLSSSRERTKACAVSHDCAMSLALSPGLANTTRCCSDRPDAAAVGVALWSRRNISGELRRGIRLLLAPAFRKCPSSSGRLMPCTTGERPRHSAIATGDGLTVPVPAARFTQSWGSDA